MALRRPSRRLQIRNEVPESLTNGLYQPYQPRKKKRKEVNLPVDVRSCWTINCDNCESGMWVERVIACTHCLRYRHDKPLNKRLSSTTQEKASRHYQCQTLWTQVLPPETTPPAKSKKTRAATITPMIEKGSHKRPRTSPIPDIITPLLLTPTNRSSVFDASAAVAISLQKDLYASSKKGSPCLLLASPTSARAYETEISCLKTALSNVRQSKSRLEEKNLGLQSCVRQLKECNSELKESNMELQESNKSLITKLATAEHTIFDLKMEVSVSSQLSDGMFDAYISKVEDRFSKGT